MERHDTKIRPAGWEAAEHRRERLRRLMDELESSLAEPPGAGPDTWRSRLSDVGDRLDAEWRSHVAATEGPGGLFDEVVEAAPRLTTAAGRVRDEHVGLTAALGHFRDAVEAGQDTAEVRSAGLALLTSLIAHRQHGADLLYEAYWVDVGGLSG